MRPVARGGQRVVGRGGNPVKSVAKGGQRVEVVAQSGL